MFVQLSPSSATFYPPQTGGNALPPWAQPLPPGLAAPPEKAKPKPARFPWLTLLGIGGAFSVAGMLIENAITGPFKKITEYKHPEEGGFRYRFLGGVYDYSPKTGKLTISPPGLMTMDKQSLEYDFKTGRLLQASLERWTTRTDISFDHENKQLTVRMYDWLNEGNTECKATLRYGDNHVLMNSTLKDGQSNLWNEPDVRLPFSAKDKHSVTVDDGFFAALFKDELPGQFSSGFSFSEGAAETPEKNGPFRFDFLQLGKYQKEDFQRSEYFGEIIASTQKRLCEPLAKVLKSKGLGEYPYVSTGFIPVSPQAVESQFKNMLCVIPETFSKEGMEKSLKKAQSAYTRRAALIGFGIGSIFGFGAALLQRNYRQQNARADALEKDVKNLKQSLHATQSYLLSQR